MSKKQKSDTKTVRSPLLKILKRFLKFALLQSICTVMSAVVIFASFVDWFYEPTSWWNVKKYNFKARSKNQLGKTFEHAIKTITDATLMPISHNKVVCSLQRQMHVPSVTYRKLHDDVMRLYSANLLWRYSLTTTWISGSRLDIKLSWSLHPQLLWYV